jgi:lipopolysaccharide export system protein LptA
LIVDSLVLENVHPMRLFLYSGILFISLPIFSVSFRPPILESYSNNTVIDIDKIENPKKKKEIITSTWGGNALSQETKTVEGIENTVFSLTGGAWIQHKKVRLTANSIEIIGQEALKGFLNGSTKVEDLENKITLYAGKGYYDKFAETIILEGNPTLIFKDKENKITKITSPKLKRNLGNNTTVFEDGVIIENSEYTIYANKSTFFESEKKLQLEDKPIIFSKDIFITGEQAFHFLNTKTTEVDGSAIIIRQSLEDKAKSKTKKNNTDSEEPIPKVKIYSYFTGDKIINIDEAKEKSTGVFGSAKLTRPDLEMTASYIKSIGSGNQFIEAKENVEILDKENNTKLYGDILEYNKEKNYTHLTENAKIEFLNKGTNDITSTLTAVEIERFGNLKEIVFRGNVEIAMDTATLNGEYATYFESEKKIHLDGNPSINRDGKKVFCGLIVIYPNQNKILMTDGINYGKKK